MFTEPLIHEPIIGITSCSFRFPYTEEAPPKVKKTNVFLNIPTNTDPLPNNRELRENEVRGWVAVRHTLNRSWFVADATISPQHTSKIYFISCVQTEICDAIALGVDSRMKREDIDGATIVYKENNKWLFAHATEEDHHNRILAAEAAIATVFDELVMSRLIRSHPVVLPGTSAIDQDERSTSEQRGALTVLQYITDFKHDCMRFARYNEGQLHIGEHVKNPEGKDIYSMIEKAFADAKKKWQKSPDENVVTAYNLISRHLSKIEKRLKSRQTLKRRWEIPVVFPNAQQTETESS